MLLQTITIGTATPDIARVIALFIGLFLFLLVFLSLAYYFITKPEPKCPSCYKEFKKGEIFCPKCGLRIGGPCPSCGKRLRGRGEYCPYCNQKLSRPLPSAGWGTPTTNAWGTSSNSTIGRGISNSSASSSTLSTTIPAPAPTSYHTKKSLLQTVLSPFLTKTLTAPTHPLRCPSCQATVQPREAFCGSCGYALEQTQVK